ncbi:hypothetical protein ACROYT_G013764 [Oculina patagonica]
MTMGDESPTISGSKHKSIDPQDDIDIEVRPSKSSCVTLEEIAPQNNTISDGKQNKQVQQRTWIRKLVRQRGPLAFTGKKNVRRYYKQQEKTKAAFEEVNIQDFGRAAKSSSEDNEESKVSIAVNMSMLCNTGLLIAKAIAAYLSGSMSIISSLVDSAVDLVSGLVMWYTTHAIKCTNYYEYPEGKTRLEPIGIIVLAVIMAVASIQVIISSVTKIIEQSADPDISIPTIAIIGGTVLIKVILFLYCRRVKKPSTDVLAQDHRNDIVSNIFALGFGYLGYKVWSNADPLGAILISLYIILGWYKTGKEQIRGLTGHTARPVMLQKLLWVCMNHDRRIQFIDTLRAYHFGNNILVEAHIVLPADMTLFEAHDIGESLQNKLESYSDVERAFVHIDYDYEHHPSIEHKMGQPVGANTSDEALN